MNYLNSTLTETQIRRHLGNYGIPGDVALKKVSMLPAGQRISLPIAKRLHNMPSPTVLIIDEISENLDIETRQSLAELLNYFSRAVLLVSHDDNFCVAFKPTTR